MSNKIYKALAPYYDRLMADVNYKAWVEYIKNICALNHLEPKTIFDLGCGTGTTALQLLEKKYDVIGLDGSIEMLNVAKEKLHHYNPSLILGRFECFAIRKKVDLAISLFDSLNNLIQESELLNAFKCVENSLVRKGLFIFDMNTIYGLSQMNSSSTFTKDNNGTYSIWKSNYNRAKCITTLYLTLFVSENGYYRRVEETHIERGYSLTTIKKLLMRSGFTGICFYEHPTFRKPNSRTRRVMVVARKD